MKSCVACGMPAPDGSSSCAYCGQFYDSPSAYELSPSPTTFLWRTATTTLAEARIEDGIWRISAGPGAKPQISMLAIRRDSKYTVALLDKDLQRVSTVIVRIPDPSTGESSRFLAVVNDDVKTCLVIHGDGPTGFHIVNRQGDVVGLASPRPGFPLSGMDALLTGTHYDWKPLEFFAIVFSLMLAKISAKKCDLTDIDHLCLDSDENLEGSASDDN